MVLDGAGRLEKEVIRWRVKIKEKTLRVCSQRAGESFLSPEPWMCVC